MARTSASQKQHEDEIIAKALGILESRMRTPGQTFDAPDAVKAFLSLAIGEKPHEVFGVLFLDVHNRLLAFEEMFQGTLTQTSVYPREVVLRALHHQAAAVVLSHNHPSGASEGVQRISVLKRLFAKGKAYRFSDFARETNAHTELTKAVAALSIKRAMMYHGINEPETFEPVGIALKRVSDCVEERFDRMRQRQVA